MTSLPKELNWAAVVEGAVDPEAAEINATAAAVISKQLPEGAAGDRARALLAALAGQADTALEAGAHLRSGARSPSRNPAT